MEIRLLADQYKSNDQLYKDFISNKINENAEYYSDDYLFIENIPDFPIYMGKGSQKKKDYDFNKAINTILKYYLNTHRDIHLNGRFWHSLFIGYKNEFITTTYPIIESSKKEFHNIVLKKFDWENYVYKCVLAADYIDRLNLQNQKFIDYYISLVIDNLDLFNYILKYQLFRNADFIMNLLTIIDEEDISKEMKAKIKHPSIGNKDLRYGREVVFELNKSYPVVMSPALEKDKLRIVVLDTLKKIQDKYGYHTN